MRQCFVSVVLAILVTACSPADPAVKPVTWAQYENVQPGMTYSEVKKLLGQKGEKTGSNDVGNDTVRTYSFGPPDAEILVQFNGNVVLTKYPGTLKAPPLSQ